MTTATKRIRRKLSATEENQRLEAAVAAARENLAEVRQRAHEHRQRIEGLRQALAERQGSAQHEFTDTGLPRPGTEADELADEIQKLIDADGFDGLVSAAERAVSAAEMAVRKHREDSARQLLDELVPRAIEARRRFLADVTAVLEGSYREMVQVGTEARQIVTAARELDSPIPDFDHQLAALRAALQEPPLALPRKFTEEQGLQ